MDVPSEQQPARPASFRTAHCLIGVMLGLFGYPLLIDWLGYSMQDGYTSFWVSTVVLLGLTFGSWSIRIGIFPLGRVFAVLAVTLILAGTLIDRDQPPSSSKMPSIRGKKMSLKPETLTIRGLRGEMTELDVKALWGEPDRVEEAMYEKRYLKFSYEVWYYDEENLEVVVVQGDVAEVVGEELERKSETLIRRAESKARVRDIFGRPHPRFTTEHVDVYGVHTPEVLFRYEGGKVVKVQLGELRGI